MGRPADGGGDAHAPAPASGDFRRGAEALKKFKKRVDGILKDLDTSPASKSRVADQRITRDSLSTDGAAFAEADGLFTQYNRVHTELTSLSQMLSDQIEAMAIAVHGADVGFDKLEDDVKRRFWAIQTRIHERAEADKKSKEAKEHGGHQKPQANDKKLAR